MQFKLTEQEQEQYSQKDNRSDYTKLFNVKPEVPQEIQTGSQPTMFPASATAMTSSPSSSPTYQETQATSNIGYTGSMYMPGTRSVLPSMQYLSNGSQGTSASFWGMQSELGYSHTHGNNNGSPLTKPFPFDPAQNSTSPSRSEGVTYPTASTMTRPNPYSSYMGTDISPWSMAIQQGLHRIGAGNYSFSYVI